MNIESYIPIFGMLTGGISLLAVFIWLYFDAQGKRKAVVEIAKHLDDSTKVEELLTIFEDRRKEPIDYKRGGVITLFVGIGLFSLGYYFLGDIFRGVGALVAMIGMGTLIAGYLYPKGEGK